MKKSLLIPVTLLMLIVTGSFAQNKRVAVVSFYVSKQIDVSDFGAAAKEAAITLSDDPNFNLTPLLIGYHDQFFNSYAKNFPFDLIAEGDVINTDAYKTFVPEGNESDANAKYVTPYTGYKILTTWNENDNIKHLLAIFSQYDGLMKVDISFRMLKYGFNNMGVVKMMATTTISLHNKDGKRVFAITENGKSKSVNPMVAGIPVMTTDKVLPMCQSAMDELMKALDKDLPKLIKKTDAKL
ncbi:hypothetical protein HDF18_08440 [Mucilaginibacter sp. X5P1]|uniref:hypothetical protein n=1 Tax=Mucilaginibacter sp. X5P1 TaxID=2723088 RepID=UPI0016112830|nr:hypothetical protein [Mucilaginibacter sp. X5P1]MBB6137685.1 hypothetical protein [Mucilaginibacter sp. X5P1]